MPADGDSRLAVVDLGSNSFRLVVFSVHGAKADTLGGWWKRTDEIYEPVRIGEGVDATGALGDEGMARAIAAIEVFAHFAQAAGLSAAEVDAVATSAIREASNSEAFLERARSASGLAIRVLSREEEGHYGYLAAINSTDLTDGAVLDLGGGSMQLVHVEERLARDTDSWRLGAIRMTERFLQGDEPKSAKQLDKLRDHVARKLERAQWLSGSGTRIVGLGGTVRNLAAAVQRAGTLPEFGVQGFLIERAALDELVDRLAGDDGRRAPPRPRDQAGARRHHPGGRRRRAVGASRPAASTGSRRPRPACARVSSSSARSAGRPRPLLDDVRRASVLNLAAQYDPNAAHTPSRRRSGARPVRRAGRRPGSTPGIRSSASCCGRRACCTTSAWSSTTTTTTSTRAI